MENLVIVESPAKAKTIKKYLGKNFEVMASYGHVRDLMPKEGAVDPEHQFAMAYQIIEKNSKHVTAIKKAIKEAKALFLATDPDREGEAIAWHIYEILQQQKALKGKTVHRVVFHQITKNAIKEAVDHPREISMDLVNAQQARRALDYLVGFKLSPLLWRKIRQGLSAGRVQSPALRLIVEREEEIEKFKPQEYWSITALNEKDKQEFKARLVAYQGKKLEQFSITQAKEAEAIKKTLLEKTQGTLTVSKVEKKQRKRNPTAPFITSTLQQEAIRKLGFTAQRTMRVAQQLYEGIDLGSETVGLITYMRTDSVNLANEAIADIRDYIVETYGKENLPKEIPIYKTKSKNAQEAHEAIRPTSVYKAPESLQKKLNDEQFKLYELIWKRTVACQMIPATINLVSIDLTCGMKDCFRATGSTIAVPGFLTVYQESLDDNAATEEDRLLPELKEGETVTLKEITCLQHFTEPPPRYSEASLVKTLEEFGIGRPSTYASIISTLQNRKYAYIDKKRFYPTDIGRIVNKFLTHYFTQYVDYDFTANLEDTLDAISRGEKQWIPVLDEFWHPFIKKIEEIGATVQRKDVTQEPIDEKCPECGNPLSIRLGRNGRFIGCSGYPDCSYTRNLHEDKNEDSATEAEIVADRKCPKCKGDLVIKHGPYGKFIGCSNYPKCKFIEPLEKPEDTKVTCPVCKKGTILKRKSKRGKIFYSCSKYPKCTYALWNMPIAETCPACHWPILTLKETKRAGKEIVCPQEACKYKRPAED
ncbi:MAG: DNA topoisomerase I [Gammaproteobacteria bacterium RIFCSPHIGHO2_12_FULL_35_23]|nr:MAG: DNA topoisomerase I [Gammaproteobacteria bacterium RIFCSPHIGHO2_12_FULL_35_23]